MKREAEEAIQTMAGDTEACCAPDGRVDAEMAGTQGDRGELLAAAGLVGQMLSPFFLQDPERGTAGESYAALAALDAEQAGQEWPFVEAPVATECLTLMQQGLAAGQQAMGEEYRRLFVGPFKKVAPPWGSVYTDKDCVIFGASTLALRAWMHANGISRQTSERDPDDHIGLLLAMLPWLAAERPELMVEFLRDHVLTWSGHFLQIVEGESGHPFYRGLARLTRESLAGMQDELAIDVSYPRFYR